MWRARIPVGCVGMQGDIPTTSGCDGLKHFNSTPRPKRRPASPDTVGRRHPSHTILSSRATRHPSLDDGPIARRIIERLVLCRGLQKLTTVQGRGPGWTIRRPRRPSCRRSANCPRIIRVVHSVAPSGPSQLSWPVYRFRFPGQVDGLNIRPPFC